MTFTEKRPLLLSLPKSHFIYTEEYELIGVENVQLTENQMHTFYGMLFLSQKEHRTNIRNKYF